MSDFDPISSLILDSDQPIGHPYSAAAVWSWGTPWTWNFQSFVSKSSRSANDMELI